MNEINCKFAIGQLVKHLLFDYRGVVVDVDATFQGTEAWYEQMARSKPPKDNPWYHVLVHNAQHMTYVAERNLVMDKTHKPIDHPLVEAFFSDFKNGHYVHMLN